MADIYTLFKSSRRTYPIYVIIIISDQIGKKYYIVLFIV